MKKFFILLMLFASLAVSANDKYDGEKITFRNKASNFKSNREFYIGISAGAAFSSSVNSVDTKEIYDNYHGQHPYLWNLSVETNENYSGYRFFGGYAVSPKLAFEAGFMLLHDAGIKIASKAGSYNYSDDNLFDENYYTIMLDLLLRLSLPVSNRFAVYTKLGMSYAFMDALPDFKDNEITTEKVNSLGLVAGLGIQCRSSKQTAVDLSWLHYHNLQDTSQVFRPHLEFVSLGFTWIIPASG